MTLTQTLKELNSLGTAQTRKTYGRHGISGDVYGVKYGDLNKLVKKIGADHALALELWETGNHDARVLATMVADPSQTKAGLLDGWAKAIDNRLLVDAVAKLAARVPRADKQTAKWIRSKWEWIGSTGWHLLATRLAVQKEAVDAAELLAYLRQIEMTIDDSPNEVRYAMNSALIAIGLVSPELEEQALAAAKRIGKVEVDHGDTSCKTPDAAAYIKKAAAHAAKCRAK